MSLSATSPVGLRVLVVDDDEDIRDIYVESLTLNGYEVVEASNGEEALSLAFVEPPAAVIMDLHMPVMDGFAATHRLKQDSRTMRVPVIVVTGSGGATQAERARLSGCDAVLAKPCPPDVVILAIEHVLRGEPIPHRFRAF